VSEWKLLERTHRFCAKLLQEFHPRTKTTIALSMLGWYTMAAYIDRRKLLFLGRLCRLDNDILVKKMFLNRLHQCLMGCTAKSLGFIPDIVGILKKYNLTGILDHYVTDGQWPDKKPWRSMVDISIHEYEVESWNSKVNTDKECSRYGEIITKYGKPHVYWNLSNKMKSLQSLFIFMAKLCTLPHWTKYIISCEYCGRSVKDQLEHYIVSCEKYEDVRESYWSVIINQTTVGFSTYLYNQPDSGLVEIMLGKQIPEEVGVSQEMYELFLVQTAKSWYCLKYEDSLFKYV
jgi:hypothetical protein